jgi:RimJ/RimL family protein N-acetyltransferase
LQEATASEPLTLEEEFAMQRSWREDGDKLTFIACLPPLIENAVKGVTPLQHDSPEKMIGDVNLFLSSDEEYDSDRSGVIGELEIMIARRDLQRQGYGRSVLLTFIWYVLENIDGILQEFRGSETQPIEPSRLKALRVRIGSKNDRSIRLFESLGFQKTTETPNYFGEWELRWTHDRTDEMTQKVKQHVACPEVKHYEILENGDDTRVSSR